MFKKYSWMFISVLVLGLILSACQSDDGADAGGDSSDSEEGTILKVATSSLVNTWDPSIASTAEGLYLANIYETLVKANPIGSEEQYAPFLAEEWESSEDGKTWTFYLREDVEFQDGEAFNAEAVEKSVTRTMDIGKGYANVWDPVEEVTVIDEYTVEFELDSAVGFLANVSSGLGAWMMSPAIVDKEEAWFNEGNAVGTGPYSIRTYEAENQTILERNESYWKEDVGDFDLVSIKIVDEDVVQQQMLTSGEVDVATSIPIENLETLEEDENVNVIDVPSTANFFAFFNTEKAPLDDKLVRQALSYAIPYEKIIDLATGGKGAQAKGPVPRDSWPSDESLKSYDYDIEKAKDLLDEAGVNPEELELTITYNSKLEEEAKAAVLMKEGLAELGVELIIKPMTFGQQWELGKANPEDAQDIFIVRWWLVFLDGHDVLQTGFETEEEPFWNLAYWYNDEFDSLINEAYGTASVDEEKSQDLYTQAQELIIEEAPALYLFDAPYIVYTNNSIDEGEAVNSAYYNAVFFNEMKQK